MMTVLCWLSRRLYLGELKELLLLNGWVVRLVTEHFFFVVAAAYTLPYGGCFAAE